MSTSVLIKRSDGTFEFLRNSKVIEPKFSSQRTPVIDVREFTSMSIQTPGDFVTANLSLEASSKEDGTFVNVHGADTNQVQLTGVVASRVVVVGLKASDNWEALNLIAPLHFLRFHSSEAGNNDKTITIMLSR